MIIPLKAKYLVKSPNNGGKSHGRGGGMFSSDPKNKTKKYSKKHPQGKGHRRRQGLGGFIQF